MSNKITKVNHNIHQQKASPTEKKKQWWCNKLV